MEDCVVASRGVGVARVGGGISMGDDVLGWVELHGVVVGVLIVDERHVMEPVDVRVCEVHLS